jgi:uncharacterized protein involved in exopolysaccharide biosynthesis
MARIRSSRNEVAIMKKSAGKIPTPAFVGGYRALGRNRMVLLPKALLLLSRSIIAIFVLGLRRRSPAARYHLLGAIATVAGCVAITFGYIKLVPKVYASKWTLILPTAASNVDLRVESVGHAQTVASSPFGSSSLSPKVIYREILASEQVRQAAAVAMSLNLASFGSARVKLVDETALMFLEIKGQSPQQAQKKALELNKSFFSALNTLRADELRRRADVVKDSLGIYQQNLAMARQRIIDHQAATGILSMNQFNETVTSLEQTRRKLSDTRAEMEKLSTEQTSLTAMVGLAPTAAAAILRLAGDPEFAKLTVDLAEVQTLIRTDARRLGDAHPIAVNLHKRFEHAVHQIQTQLAAAVPELTQESRFRLVSNGTHTSEMMRTLILANLTYAGRRAEYEVLDEEFKKLSGAVARMSNDVARLEDLKKDHLVAEAVFTSALARLNTNRTDIYASYPMVQMLAEPDLADETANPSSILVIALGLLASLLAIAGWSTSWLRYTFNLRRQKKG